MVYRVLAVFVVVVGFFSLAHAQLEYRVPAPALKTLVDAPMQPASTVSPDKRWVAAFEWNWVVSLGKLAAEELKLAGLRITPASFTRSRARSYDSIALHDLDNGSRIAVEGLPAGRIGAPSWSSDSHAPLDAQRFTLLATGQHARVSLDGEVEELSGPAPVANFELLPDPDYLVSEMLKIDQPMLMIHGMEDNNFGTYPMQSERMFDALKGLGAEARLVMLPHESHRYRARPSLLHMLLEQHRWLEKYLGE